MHRYGRMSDFKFEAAHSVKIQEFGSVAEIRQEFMVSLHPIMFKQKISASMWSLCTETQSRAIRNVETKDVLDH